ncbi:MAG TPA: DUF1697 domain-containing protein [Gemmatimonadaceae bacterium]|nr:DUF1697 domain-containing protein [Gemmatimonadaceae bacterium]
MPRYVALLRAINVGGRNVKMTTLCALFEQARLSNVQSVIASGNVLFDSRSADTTTLERRIEGALREGLGYEVATFVRSGAELDAVVAHRPFDSADPVLDSHTVHVIFTRATIDAERATKILALGTEYDEFHVFGREVFWRTRGRSSDSKIKPGAFARAFGDPGTARNITTVRKLAERLRA